MELRRLRYFVVLAEELHFGRAARRLHMAQPPLSQQIRRLEEAMGVRLFERSHHRVELSHAGALFLDQARLVLEQAERAVTVAQRADRGELGVLEVGFTSSLPFSDLFATLLGEFHQRRRDVRLQLRELSSLEQLKRLAEGSLDVGLLRPAQHAWADSVEAWPIASDSFVVALPEQHPLARLRRVALGRLRDEPFVLYSQVLGSGLTEQILALCLAAGFVPRVEQEVLEMPTIIGLVAAGIGVGIVTESMSRLHVPGVTYRRLAGAQPTLELLLCARRGRRSPAADQFIEVVLESARRAGTRPPRSRPARPPVGHDHTRVKRPASAARQSGASSESVSSSSSPALRKR